MTHTERNQTNSNAMLIEQDSNCHEASLNNISTEPNEAYNLSATNPVYLHSNVAYMVLHRILIIPVQVQSITILFMFMLNQTNLLLMKQKEILKGNTTVHTTLKSTMVLTHPDEQENKITG